MYLDLYVCGTWYVLDMYRVHTRARVPMYHIHTVVQVYKLKEELIFDYFFFIYFGLTVPYPCV